MSPLHPDRNPDLKGRNSSEQPEHYKNAYNFLNQVAKKAFETNEKGAYLIDINTTFQPDHSGDVRPQYTQDINKKRFSKKTLNPPPYEWPNLNSQKSQHQIYPTKSNNKTQPNPAAEHNTPAKRTCAPHPLEYCNRCWKFGEHFSDFCLEDQQLQCPKDFTSRREHLKQTHQAARNHETRQKKYAGTSGETGGEGMGLRSPQRKNDGQSTKRG